MSWSFTGVGRPKAVAEKFKKQIDNTPHTFPEPERGILSKVFDIVDEALSHYPPLHAVSVEASGSQSQDSNGLCVNTLILNIKPIYGFVE